MTSETKPSSRENSDSEEQRMVFVSHKHKDKELAKIVGSLLRTLSGFTIDAFVSSSTDSKGPGFGQNIDDELKSALAKTGLVVLVYTDPTENWDWCMWECGVATDPNDTTPTNVVVFTFGGEPPDKYKSTRNVSFGKTREKGDAKTAIHPFAIDFCRQENMFPDGGSPVNTSISDAEISDACDKFVDDIFTLDSFGINPYKKAIIEVIESISTHSAEKLYELVKPAKEALEWGLTDGPHKEFFNQNWDKIYVPDFKNLENRVLVFRPPTGKVNWDRLLRTLLTKNELGDEAYLRLVTGESSNPLDFWQDAMGNPASDARAYEEPVRNIAQELYEIHRKPIVERRFLFKRDFFKDGSTFKPFKSVCKWMNDSNIIVSIGSLEDVTESDWADFAIIGNYAVSRFSSLESIVNRRLLEFFHPQEIDSAFSHWKNELKPRWRSNDGVSLTDYLSKNDGIIV